MTLRRIGLLLAAIVATVSLAYELRVHVFPADRSFPQLIELAPAHSTFIAYVDLAELRKEPLVAHLAALAEPVKVDPDYQQFISSTGFDYQRDLDQVVIAETADEKVAIADGRFDRKKIEEYASRSGSIEQRDGHTIYVVKSKTPGQTISLTFLGAHRIALGEGGDFSGYLASRLASSRAPLDPAMRQRLSRVAGSPAFAGWKIPDSLTHGAGQTGSFAVPALQSLRGVDLAIKPDGEQLLISVEGECDDSLQAQNLSASLDFLRTILPAGLTGTKVRSQMSAENAALVARLVKATEITTNNDRVRLLLAVSPDMIGGSAPAQ